MISSKRVVLSVGAFKIETNLLTKGTREGSITCDWHRRLSEEILKAVQSDLKVFSRWWLNSRNPLILQYPSTQDDTTDTLLFMTNSAVKYAYKEHYFYLCH